MTRAGSAGWDFLKRHARALIASIVLALGLGWIMHRGALPLLPPKGTLEHVHWFYFSVMVFLLVVNLTLRFIRYLYLLKPITTISMRRLIGISSLAIGLITFLPFRLGEMARPAMLREKGKISGWAVTGTVAAERIIDGVLFSATLLLGLVFARPHEPLPDHIGDLPVPASLVPQAAQVATAFFGVCFVIMAVFFWWRAIARSLTERVLGIVSKNLADKVADAVERVSDGLRFLPNLRYTVPYVLLSMAALLAHIVGMQFLALSVGLPWLSLAQATVVVGVLGLGFAMPNAPGFFGSVQLALYAGLAIYVAPSQVVHEGAALVFLFYLTYLALVVVCSVVGVLLEYVLPAGVGAGIENELS